MNFLDPDNWNDLEALENKYQELNEALIKDLHNKLRPYFLRRVKSEVLELPPKVDLCVSLLNLVMTAARTKLSSQFQWLRCNVKYIGPF